MITPAMREMVVNTAAVLCFLGILGSIIVAINWRK